MRKENSPFSITAALILRMARIECSTIEEFLSEMLIRVGRMSVIHLVADTSGEPWKSQRNGVHRCVTRVRHRLILNSRSAVGSHDPATRKFVRGTAIEKHDWAPVPEVITLQKLLRPRTKGVDSRNTRARVSFCNVGVLAADGNAVAGQTGRVARYGWKMKTQKRCG